MTKVEPANCGALRRIAGGLTLLVASACSGDPDSSARTQTGSASSASPERSSDEAYAILTDLVAHESRTNFDDLEAMRQAAPIAAALLAALAAAAPEEITADVKVLRDAVGDWQRTIEDPEFSLDPDILYVWQTAQSQRASAALIVWADDNCPVGIEAEALQPVTLMLCLPANAEADDVQALVARALTPSDSGRGNDLLEGVQSVSARLRGVAVTLSPLVSPEQKAEIVSILGAPPVVDVIEGDGSCQ